MAKNTKLKQELPPEENYLFAASASDMTGLIPGNRPDEAERDSYEEVYPYQPQAAQKGDFGIRQPYNKK